MSTTEEKSFGVELKSMRELPSGRKKIGRFCH